jgi:phosphoadenosine phosphosulfate reductase
MSPLSPPLAAQVDAAVALLTRHQPRRAFATSSFQPGSVVLLHIIATRAPWLPVYFLDTGYHFPETLRFRSRLAREWGLVVRDLRSALSRSEQRSADGRLLFAADPDRCCHLNKVAPMEALLASHEVWVSGVRSSQSATRAAMAEEEVGRGGILRVHPMLRWHARDLWAYRVAYDLPAHPLEDAGYASIGCQPCTRSLLSADLDDRGGRWTGQKKTECGMHLAGDLP